MVKAEQRTASKSFSTGKNVELFTSMIIKAVNIAMQVMESMDFFILPPLVLKVL